MNPQQGRTCGTYQAPRNPNQTLGRPSQTPRKPNPTPGKSNNQDKVIHRNNNQARYRHPHIIDGDKPLVSRDLGAGSGGSQALVRMQPQNSRQPLTQQPQQWTLGGIGQDQTGFTQTQSIPDGRVVNLFNNCTINLFQTSSGSNLRSAPRTGPSSQNDQIVPKIAQPSQQGKDVLGTNPRVRKSPMQHPRDYIDSHKEEMEAWNRGNWDEVRASRGIDTIAWLICRIFIRPQIVSRI